MDCGTCRGACCEYFGIRQADLQLPSRDVEDWLELHGSVEGGWILFDVRCRELTPEGRCAIYHGRPGVCRDMGVGGPECLEAVRRRRLPAEYDRIRGPGDPPTATLLPWGLTPQHRKM